ncbi:hypothetical protein Calag_0189 [Caldisphaera lagunensis DSM 15908]|uniref:ABC-type transport system involved in multi-copper enzyme maturation, permease component n=1 Tax=Caldisphaera lagunensis (strain DSM 15908 / JCM 11604 / ANMR 0165 / IC-154) TaxID=1056495 RepID=L0AA13_CALLD|nr:ABC transporter permease [Caldisphaera lagunensis]AFZ69972.1 hypothetical protein Calag_0189 [Caldisphaera lagunensis DSM 15908]
MSQAMIYDMKRTITKPLVIILIIGLVAAGIGVAYLEVRALSAQSSSYSVVYAMGIANNGTKIIALAINPQGNAIGNAKVLINNSWYVTNSSGYLTINQPNGTGFTFTNPTTIQINGVNYTATLSMVSLTGVNLKEKTAIIYVGTTTFPINGVNQNNITYRVYFAQESLTRFERGISSNLNYTYIGNITGFTIAKFNVKINVNEPVIFVRLEPMGTAYKLGNMTFTTTSSTLEVPDLQKTAITTASYVFAEFFPLVGLFLVNEMFASLRANGAIDFIASRPITRKQLLVSRYIGGTFALIVGSLITSLLIPITVSYLMGTSVSLNTIGKMFGMLLVDTIGFYSLLYLISSSIRKDFIPIGIVLYLILYLFNIFNIVALFTGIFDLMYVTPYGLYEVVMGGINLGFSASANNLIVSISGILWIIVPIILAIIIYDKNDLP